MRDSISKRRGSMAFSVPVRRQRKAWLSVSSASGSKLPSSLYRRTSTCSLKLIAVSTILPDGFSSGSLRSSSEVASLPAKTGVLLRFFFLDEACLAALAGGEGASAQAAVPPSMTVIAAPRPSAFSARAAVSARRSLVQAGAIKPTHRLGAAEERGQENVRFRSLRSVVLGGTVGVRTTGADLFPWPWG